MAVFPYLGSIGGTDTTEYRKVLHEYDDGSFREYRRSNFKHRTIEWTLRSASKTQRNAIETFYNANENINFDFYVHPEATKADLDGNTGTGRHTARFRSPLSISNSGKCRFDITLTIKLLT